MHLRLEAKFARLRQSGDPSLGTPGRGTWLHSSSIRLSLVQGPRPRLGVVTPRCRRRVVDPQRHGNDLHATRLPHTPKIKLPRTVARSGADVKEQPDSRRPESLGRDFAAQSPTAAMDGSQAPPRRMQSRGTARFLRA